MLLAVRISRFLHDKLGALSCTLIRFNLVIVFIWLTIIWFRKRKIINSNRTLIFAAVYFLHIYCFLSQCNIYAGIATAS